MCGIASVSILSNLLSVTIIIHSLHYPLVQLLTFDVKPWLVAIWTTQLYLNTANRYLIYAFGKIF